MSSINQTALSVIRDLNSLLAFLRNTDPSNGRGWMIREGVEAEKLFYDYGVGNFAKVDEGLKLRGLIYQDARAAIQNAGGTIQHPYRALLFHAKKAARG